jgi:hypothetical protein
LIGVVPHRARSLRCDCWLGKKLMYSSLHTCFFTCFGCVTQKSPPAPKLRDITQNLFSSALSATRDEYLVEKVQWLLHPLFPTRPIASSNSVERNGEVYRDLSMLASRRSGASLPPIPASPTSRRPGSFWTRLMHTRQPILGTQRRYLIFG